jgi:GTPase SAR1 family protein
MMRKKLRVVLLGDFGVGKTSLFRQFLDHKFSEAASNTAMEDERLTSVKVADQDVDLLITDTAGLG